MAARRHISGLTDAVLLSSWRYVLRKHASRRYIKVAATPSSMLILLGSQIGLIQHSAEMNETQRSSQKSKVLHRVAVVSGSLWVNLWARAASVRW